MRSISNKEKLEILKLAKGKLIDSLGKTYDKDHDPICWCIGYVLKDKEIVTREEYNDILPIYAIQRRFEMNIVKPKGVYSYWWNFDQSGFLSRKRAINTLIKHFKSKLK